MVESTEQRNTALSLEFLCRAVFYGLFLQLENSQNFLNCDTVQYLFKMSYVLCFKLWNDLASVLWKLSVK